MSERIFYGKKRKEKEEKSLSVVTKGGSFLVVRAVDDGREVYLCVSIRLRLLAPGVSPVMLHFFLLYYYYYYISLSFGEGENVRQPVTIGLVIVFESIRD